MSPFGFQPSKFANILALLLLASRLCCAQVLNVEQTMEVQNLPSLVAASGHRSDILLTSLDTIIHDREICCGKDSALEDSLQSADPASLKDVAGKLNGRHLLSDGRPIMVRTDFLPSDEVNSGNLLTMLKTQHAPLMSWNSHIYVVHGVIYEWVAYGAPDSQWSPQTAILKFLLWDTRYSDSRRDLVFNRDIDDLSKVQGLLFLSIKPQ